MVCLCPHEHLYEVYSLTQTTPLLFYSQDSGRAIQSSVCICIPGGTSYSFISELQRLTLDWRPLPVSFEFGSYVLSGTKYADGSVGRNVTKSTYMSSNSTQLFGSQFIIALYSQQVWLSVWSGVFTIQRRMER